MRLRTTYKGFTEAVDLYFDHLMLRVVPLQVKEQTGPALRAPAGQALGPAGLTALPAAAPFSAEACLVPRCRGREAPKAGAVRAGAGTRRRARGGGSPGLSVRTRSAGSSCAGETPLGQPLACEEGAFSL